MKTIKICIVSLYAYQYFNPASLSRAGGAELQLHNMAVELAKDRRFEIEFIVGDFGQPDFEIRKGIKLYKFFNPKKNLKYLRAVLGFVKLWRQVKKINADIYIQRTAGLETGEVALFCKLNHKKFIYMTAHDEDVIGTKPSWMQGGLVGFVRWRLFKLGLKIADLIIVQHESQKEVLKEVYGKDGIIRQSAHYIPESIPLNKDFILWVARGEDWKQPFLFIELVKFFPGEKFVMICPPTNDFKFFNEIKGKAMGLPNLEFIEFLPSDKFDSYFLNAKIYVNTSKSEGFPNTFIQALKGKTPVLSLNVNPNGMLEKYGIGRCANGDFEKLKNDLKEILGDKELLHVMAEKAYAYAKENHDIMKIIEDDKKLILNLEK